jgi:hypothetical protein
LQVRPITKVSSKITTTSKLAVRYVNLVSRIIKSNNLILGDMIDINPEELV